MMLEAEGNRRPLNDVKGGERPGEGRFPPKKSGDLTHFLTGEDGRTMEKRVDLRKCSKELKSQHYMLLRLAIETTATAFFLGVEANRFRSLRKANFACL